MFAVLHLKRTVEQDFLMFSSLSDNTYCADTEEEQLCLSAQKHLSG